MSYTHSMMGGVSLLYYREEAAILRLCSRKLVSYIVGVSLLVRQRD